jgi:hypothetical protein
MYTVSERALSRGRVHYCCSVKHLLRLSDTELLSLVRALGLNDAGDRVALAKSVQHHMTFMATSMTNGTNGTNISTAVVNH